MVFTILLKPSEDGGYTATVPALPGCISEGETIEQAMDNIREAIQLYLEPIEGPQVTGEGALVKELTL